MLNIEFDHQKIAKALDRRVSDIKQAMRPAAQAGAQVLYEEMKMRVPISEHAHYFYGRSSRATGVRYFFAPGTLRDSIYQYYNKRLSTPGKAVYSVSWNHREVPYGHMVEYGTSKAPAHPFLRPAFEAASGKAREAVLSVLRSELKKDPPP